MNKKSFDYHKIFTIVVLIIVLIMTFLPINVYAIDTGDHSKVTGDPIIIYEYRSFFVVIFRIIRDIDAYFFYFGMAFILYYVSTLVALFLLIIDKKTEFKISLTISMLFMFSMIFLFMYIIWFAVVVSIVYLFLLILNIANDSSKESRAHAKELASKKETNNIIASNIRNRRKELCLTQQEVADKTFMSRSLISKLSQEAFSLVMNNCLELLNA